MVIDKYRYRRLPLVVALAFVWALVFAGQLYAKGGEIQGRRVALIVGNSNYKSVYSLKNAVSDSTSVSAVLSRLGFEVIEVSDVTKAEFSDAIDRFSEAAHDAEAAVFYYSGHGFQLGGTNFLVPVDAKLNNRKTILQETLRLNDVIEAVQDRNRQTLIFLDACRNNPLPKSVRDKSMLDGLAQLEAGTGTFVAFATQPGNITRDGAGDHSPFAAALIEHMETPGISISDMMIRVRNSVEVATLQTQTPWDQSSLRNQFYFSPEEEVSADLTDEDKALLLSLPPSLRKKFAAQFGIRFSDDGEVLTKTVEIKRRFTISAGGKSDTPDTPPVVAKKLAIKSRFTIAPGDDSSEPAKSGEPPVVVASLDPRDKKSARPELAPLDEDLASNGAKFIPLPNFRPGTPGTPRAPGTFAEEKSDDQLVAALSPRDTAPEIAQRIEPENAPEIAPETEVEPQAADDVRPESEAPATVDDPVKDASAPIAEKPVRITPTKVIPKTVRPKTNSTTVLAAKKSTTPVKTKKPRVIALTNPDQAIQPKQKAEKDVLVALNSATRSISTLKPSTKRTVLRPVVNKPKRIVGKEIEIGQGKDRKVEKGVQVANLEPVAKTAIEPELPITELEDRKVAPIGLEDAPKEANKTKDVKVASLSPDNSANNTRSDEPISPSTDPSITPPSHAFEVQTELARLGCYRSKIDGLWGANSARALFRYYGNKKVAPSELEPNAALLSMLRSDEIVVCKRTITKKHRQKIITKKSNKNSKATKTSRRKKSKRIRVRKSVSITKKSLRKKLSKGVFR